MEMQLQSGAALALSISGGKDSHAMAKAVVSFLKLNNLDNYVFAIHADLGRTEWKESLPMCQQLCKRLGIELIVVRRENGDMLERWKQRRVAMKTKYGKEMPFWSTKAHRYCTSDMKRGPINKYLRKFSHIISVEGIRADESKDRAKASQYEFRKEIWTRKRAAYTWNPILNWTMHDVWSEEGVNINILEKYRAEYKATGVVNPGWPFHPAYVYGNDRVSCMMCIMGSKRDLLNGIRHNPELAFEIAKMELDSGFTFKQSGESVIQLIPQAFNL